jgi:hypothetical protein
MEHSPESNSEQESRQALEALPSALEYVETDEMVELRQTLVEAMRAGEDTKELALRYRLMAERVAGSDEENISQLRIGMLVSIALMRRDGGLHGDYIEDLEDVLVMAEQEDFEDVALLLSEILGY